MNIFHRYVIKEHIAPFIFAFSVIMFILILKLMLQIMDLLIRNDVSFIVIAKLFIYNLAWMVALVVPMSVLVSSLMAFGRLGASGEITAMKAAGISMYRVVSPIFLLGVVLTIIMIWFNNDILPEANQRARSLHMAISLGKPMLTLKNRDGQFINDLPDITIRVNKINYENSEMNGVTVFRKEKNEYNTIIIAEKGRFETYPKGDRLALILYNGEVHRTNYEQKRYIIDTFREFKQLIKVNFGYDTTQEATKNDRTKTAAELREENESLKRRIAQFEKEISKVPSIVPGREGQIQTFRFSIENDKKEIFKNLIEIHKKNSIPFAAIVFVMIGSSLGILVRRSGASIGIGMSIGFFTLYYLFLIGGESAGDRMLVEPWLAMWLPNFIFGILGIALMIYANRR